MSHCSQDAVLLLPSLPSSTSLLSSSLTPVTTISKTQKMSLPNVSIWRTWRRGARSRTHTPAASALPRRARWAYAARLGTRGRARARALVHGAGRPSVGSDYRQVHVRVATGMTGGATAMTGRQEEGSHVTRASWGPGRGLGESFVMWAGPGKAVGGVQGVAAPRSGFEVSLSAA